VNETWRMATAETSEADLARLAEAAADTLDELQQRIEASAVRELLKRYAARVLKKAGKVK